MFTGLIEDIGTVAAIDKSGTAARLTAATSLTLDEIALGDSIAVNGACLTVVAKDSGRLTFDVSPETMVRTGLKDLKAGSRVNLERSLRLGDRLGGHLVSGHVDCIATMVERRELAGNLLLSFRLPREFIRYLVAKGSVTVDGVSLTVNSVTDDGFAVNIIPHTSAQTTLQDKRPGAGVNIETDLLAKYVERLLAGKKSEAAAGVTMELLAKSGFM